MTEVLECREDVYIARTVTRQSEPTYRLRIRPLTDCLCVHEAR